MPYSKETRQAQETARAQERRALGLCKTCPNPARLGKTRCQACADKKQKPSWKAQRYCLSCHQRITQQ